jgi:molybdenum cofactor cytidylyltransferase
METSRRKSETCAVLILAAGYSGRMGMPKAFLPFDARRTFLEKIVSEYQAFGCAPVAVVLNEEGMAFYEKTPLRHNDNIRAILNPSPEKERFFSLQTGLKELEPAGAVFLHNVDNPFLKQEVLQALSAVYKENTSLAQSLSRDIGASAHAGFFITPTYQNEGGHPVFLSQEVIKALTEAVDYSQNLRVFLEDFKQIKVPVNDADILANINSPQEYEKYFLNKK